MLTNQKIQENAHKYRKAFDSGRKAKKNGWERICPYLTKDEWIAWWLEAGYDGMSEDSAWASFRDEQALLAAN